MKREKILRTAISLFYKYGIKGVSLAQIARESGVDNGQVETMFGSKRELLAEGLEWESERVGKSIEKRLNETGSALEAIMLIGADVSRHFASACQAFYKDLNKYEESRKFIADKKERFWEACVGYFTKGVEEGDFLPELNCELAASVFVGQFTDMRPEYQIPVLVTYLKGISTPQGLKNLEELATK